MLTKVKNVLDITADTVADLANVQHKTGSIQLLGFHTKGDGGGGVFYWDATKNKSEHNGGTIIDPSIAGLAANWEYTQILYFTPAVIGKGCWVRQEKDSHSIREFGAIPNHPTQASQLLSIQSAINACKNVTAPKGIFYVDDTIELLFDDVTITGAGRESTIFHLLDNSNSHVFQGTDINDCKLSDFKVYGNKANQSIGTDNNWRGIYFLRYCKGLYIENVVVDSVVDHGMMFSDGDAGAKACGLESTVINCAFNNCGSQAHLDAGGAGGTGFAGGSETTAVIGCYAKDNKLNGFKAVSNYTNCVSEYNGSGFETGFITPEYSKGKWVGCKALYNDGDGFRNQGQGDELTFIGNHIIGNGGSGITLLNNVNKAIISNNYIGNNGRNLQGHSDIEGQDGICLTGTSTAPSNVIITGNQFFDDQITKTQYSHIYITKEVDNVVVDSSNIFEECLVQSLYVAPLAGDSNVCLGKSVGLESTVKDFDVSTVTGTTATTVIKETTIPAYSTVKSTKVKVKAVGTVSGTAGNKTIRFVVGASGEIASAQTSAETNTFTIEAEIVEIGTQLYVTVNTTEVNVGGEQKVFVVTQSSASDVVIGLSAQLSNASDSISIVSWEVFAE
jgi:hypothetical protein